MNITKDELKEAVEAAVHAVQSATPHVDRREPAKVAEIPLVTQARYVVTALFLTGVVWASNTITSHDTKILLIESKLESVSTLMVEIKEFMREDRFTVKDFEKGLEANLVPVVTDIKANRALVASNTKELEYRRGWIEAAEKRLVDYDYTSKQLQSDISEIKDLLKSKQ